MKQLTFMGETPTEALRKATEACGEYATVVGTKQIKAKTSKSPAVYEIVVVAEESFQETKRLERKVSQTRKSPRGTDVQDKELVEIRNQNKFLIEEIEKLNKNMNTIQMTLYNQIVNGSTDRFIIPPEFMSIYNDLISSKIEPELVKKIIQTMVKTTPLENKDSQEKIENIMNGLLARMIKTEETIKRDKDVKKLKIFFGPTGVGKTTTIAKIGMKYKEQDEDAKIGLINLDTFRVGAEKQALEYGKKFNLNVVNATQAKDLIQILTKKMKKEKEIMIDTAGSGQYDKEKIEILNDFLSYNKKMKIERCLLIPANIKYEDMMEIYGNFKHLGIDNVIFTKLDETNSYGNIFTFLYNTKLRASYFTTGQQVPSDIERATKKWFINKLFSTLTIDKQIKG